MIRSCRVLTLYCPSALVTFRCILTLFIEILFSCQTKQDNFLDSLGWVVGVGGWVRACGLILFFRSFFFAFDNVHWDHILTLPFRPAVSATTQAQPHTQVAATPSTSKRSAALTNTNGNGHSKNGTAPTKQQTPPCPHMEFITVDEFEAVPKLVLFVFIIFWMHFGFFLWVYCISFSVNLKKIFFFGWVGGSFTWRLWVTWGGQW